MHLDRVAIMSITRLASHLLCDNQKMPRLRCLVFSPDSAAKAFLAMDSATVTPKCSSVPAHIPYTYTCVFQDFGWHNHILRPMSGHSLQKLDAEKDKP